MEGPDTIRPRAAAHTPPGGDAMPEQPDRRHPNRLSNYAYEVAYRVVFLTISTKNRRDLLLKESHAAAVIDCIETGCQIKKLDLIAYCLMPDHLHVVLMTLPDSDFRGYVKGLKWATTKKLHDFGVDGEIWERSYWDRHHRDDEDVETIVTYVMHNPVRKELCQQPEEWPYSRYFGIPR